jgi:hypothetical protein
MRMIPTVLASVGIVLVSTTAKQPTAKVIIDRGDLAGQVELVDRATVALSNVYAGNFIDSARGKVSPPTGLMQYEISFYLPDDRRNALIRFFQGPRVFRAYVVDFIPDTARRAGYVYVPGPTDTWSGWNHRTIIRSHLEGHWSYASPAWAQRLTVAIAHARKRPAPHCPVRDSTGLLHQSDSAFTDVAELRPILEANHLHVLCGYSTTLQGVLGEWHAAGIETNLGWFAAFFFPPPRGAEAITVASTVNDGQLLTVLRGPNASRPVDSLYGADKTDFVIHKRWLFETFGQIELRTALQRAIATR